MNRRKANCGARDIWHIEIYILKCFGSMRPLGSRLSAVRLQNKGPILEHLVSNMVT